MSGRRSETKIEGPLRQIGKGKGKERKWPPGRPRNGSFYISRTEEILQGCYVITFQSLKRRPANGDCVCLGAALIFLVLPYLPASNLGCHVGFVIAERVLYTPRY